MPCSSSPGVPGCRERTGGTIVQIPRWAVPHLAEAGDRVETSVG